MTQDELITKAVIAASGAGLGGLIAHLIGLKSDGAKAAMLIGGSLAWLKPSVASSGISITIVISVVILAARGLPKVLSAYEEAGKDRGVIDSQFVERRTGLDQQMLHEVEEAMELESEVGADAVEQQIEFLKRKFRNGG